VENNRPLVTVNILSYNRKDELRNTLKKVYEQDYKNIEIIVVDNASSDGTHEMVKSEFPEVKLIQLEKNIGIAGWNKGFEIAKGDYVLVLDDDSYPEVHTIELAISSFNNKEISIIAANIFNTRMKDYETKDFNLRPNFFVGCGVFIKRDVIKKVGFFNELIFIYLHELDYCLRCYDKGINIIFQKDIIILHKQNEIRETWKNTNPYKTSFRFYHYLISYSIILIQRFGIRYVLIYLPKWILNRTIVAFRYNYFRELFKGLLFLIKNYEIIIENRIVLKEDIQKFYRYGNIPLLDRDYF